jgi:hypothetical protein
MRHDADGVKRKVKKFLWVMTWLTVENFWGWKAGADPLKILSGKRRCERLPWIARYLA